MKKNMNKVMIPIIFLSLLFSSVGNAGQVNLDVVGRSESDKKRDVSSKPVEIISFAEIKPGMVVADVLGGSGYYSELLNQVVGAEGKVYLHNNQPYMKYVGEDLANRLKDNRLKNVIRHDRETDNLDFKDNSLDAIFFVMGYHDMYHVSEGWKIDVNDFLSQLKRALKSGGKLLVIDHDALLGSGISQAQEIHRIEQDYVVKELTAHGFTLLKQSELLKNEQDDRQLSVFDPKIRGNTSKFVLLFSKA